jgi:hypothetical protein
MAIIPKTFPIRPPMGKALRHDPAKVMQVFMGTFRNNTGYSTHNLNWVTYPQ